MPRKNKKNTPEHDVKTTSRKTSSPSPSIPENRNGDDIASREVLVQIARRMQARLLQDDDARFTFAEYLKILQLIKETEGDSPKQITVRWVDPLWPKAA